MLADSAWDRQNRELDNESSTPDRSPPPFIARMLRARGRASRSIGPDGMIPLRDYNPSRTVPFVTRAIIVVNVLVFFYELTLGDATTDFLNDWGVVPGRLFVSLSGDTSLPRELATVLTSMFLHGGWLHLIGNMWYLWIFGDNVEDRMGHGRFLVFYFASGI